MEVPVQMCQGLHVQEQACIGLCSVSVFKRLMLAGGFYKCVLSGECACGAGAECVLRAGGV